MGTSPLKTKSLSSPWIIRKGRESPKLKSIQTNSSNLSLESSTTL